METISANEDVSTHAHLFLSRLRAREVRHHPTRFALLTADKAMSGEHMLVRQSCSLPRRVRAFADAHDESSIGAFGSRQSVRAAPPRSFSHLLNDTAAPASEWRWPPDGSASRVGAALLWN